MPTVTVFTPIDFPASPYTGQTFTAPTGVMYVFDGYGWTVSNFANPTYDLNTVAALLWQIRVLLQDTDLSSGAYRYSDSEIITNLNQAMGDMFRLRPDLFLEQGFIVPIFSNMSLSDLIGIEGQYISPLVYYTAGLTQLRDDEQNQDARAAAFLKTFSQTLISVS